MEEEENNCNRKKNSLQNKKRLSFSVNPIEITKQSIPHIKTISTTIVQSNKPSMRRAKTHLSETAKSILETQEKMSHDKDSLDFISKAKLKIYDKKLFKADIDLKNLITNFLHKCTIKDDDDDKDVDIKKIRTNYHIKKKEKRKNSDSIDKKIDDVFSDEVNREYSKKNIKKVDKRKYDRKRSKSSQQIMKIKSKAILQKNNEINLNDNDNNSDNNISKQSTNRNISSQQLSLLDENERKNPLYKYLRKKTIKDDKSSRNLTTFNNVYDSFSDEEANEDELEEPHCVLLPTSIFYVTWEIISSIFVFYSIIASPVLLAFSIQNDFYDTIDMISDIIFICDIVISFFTAYQAEDTDVLIVSKRKIAINYIFSYFILDLISSIPFSLISFCYNKLTPPEKTMNKKYQNIQTFGRLGKFYRVLKWTKVFRLFKIKKEKKKESKNKLISKLARKKIYKILKFAFFIIILVHLSSCMWIFIITYSSNGYGFSQILLKYNLSLDNKVQIYILSLYYLFGTITSVGYGDITPSTIGERIFLIFFLIVGCMLFSYILTALSSIFSQIDTKTQIFTEKEIILNQIRVEYSMPQTLFDKIRKALKNDFTQWKEDQLKLIDSLPGSLRNNLYLKMHEREIKHLILFKNQSYDFILFTVPLLKRISISKDDVMISCGDLIDEMYIVIRGMLSLLLGYKYENFEIGLVKYGEHFGDISMYLNDQSNYEIKAKTKQADIFTLSKSNFASIKLNFRYAIDELLKRSYTSFLALETKRKMAIDFRTQYGNLDMFNKYYKDFINDNEIFKNRNNDSINMLYNNTLENYSLTWGNNDDNTISNHFDNEDNAEGGSLYNLSSSNTLKKSAVKSNKYTIMISNLDNNNNNNSTIKNSFIGSGKKSKFGSLKPINPYYDKQNFFKNFMRKNTRTLSNKIGSIKQQQSYNKQNTGNSLLSIANLINDNNSNAFPNNQSFISTNSPKSKKVSPFIYINNLNINYNNTINRDLMNETMIHQSPRANIRGRRISVIRPSTQDIKKTMNFVNQDKFLANLNEKIENDAILQQNKGFLQDYIMDFIDEKKEEDDMSNMIKKLKKIMNGLENFTKT